MTRTSRSPARANRDARRLRAEREQAEFLTHLEAGEAGAGTVEGDEDAERWYSTNRAARRQHPGPRRLTDRGRRNRAMRLIGMQRIGHIGNPARAAGRASRRYGPGMPVADGLEVKVLAPAGIGAKHYRLAKAQRAERLATAEAERLADVVQP